MKLKFLTLTMTLLCGAALAQTQSYISLNLGLSNPTADYADADFENNDAGFASTGAEISFEGTYFFIDYVGVGGKVGFNFHSFDKKGYESAIEKAYDKQLSSMEYDIATPYLNFFFQVGPYFNLPVSEKFHITPKVLVGIVGSVSPEVETYYEFTDGDWDYDYKDAYSTSSFAPLFGLDFRYVITDHFMMKLNTEYVTFKSNYGDIITGISTGLEQKVSYFNIMLSAGIAF